MAFFIAAAYSGGVTPTSRRRSNVPARWLFSDALLGGDQPGDPFWQAVMALPRGSGIVFRHYDWQGEARLRLWAQLVAVARRRHLWLVASQLPAARGGNGIHWPAFARHDRHPARIARGRNGLVTAAAHSRPAVLRAFADGADCVFLSPVFPTGSHIGAAGLGPLRFGLFVRGAPGPVLALGGMTDARAQRLTRLGAAGFAAIGYWLKMNRVNPVGRPVVRETA